MTLSQANNLTHIDAHNNAGLKCSRQFQNINLF